MPLLSEYSTDFELPPEGKCSAWLVSFVDLGVHSGKFGASRQANLAFEIAGVKTAEGQPMLAFKRVFNLSPRSKNFRDVVRALSGMHDIRGVSAEELVGKACELIIEHVANDDGNVFCNVECRPLKAKPLGKPETAQLYFSLHPNEYNAGILNSLPDRLRGKITASETYKELNATVANTRKNKGKPAAAIIDDDFPENLQ